MAAGKSIVARLLAARFEYGVGLEGDVFRRNIVAGRAEMTADPSPRALEQLRLRYRIAASAADAYVDAGFTVAVEDVVAGPLLAEYVELIRSRPLHVVVLMPSLEAIAARDDARGACRLRALLGRRAAPRVRHRNAADRALARHLRANARADRGRDPRANGVAQRIRRRSSSSTAAGSSPRAASST